MDFNTSAPHTIVWPGARRPTVLLDAGPPRLDEARGWSARTNMRRCRAALSRWCTVSSTGTGFPAHYTWHLITIAEGRPDPTAGGSTWLGFQILTLVSGALMYWQDFMDLFGVCQLGKKAVV